ncbi:uncharacterized protein EAF01_011638 [Botrytis porri]|uniref:uncharacterized protein n=1 Tax=Botrytis porri TaxID=87229 RepID=UPI0019006DD9|nr:uncharacterized protein EAF01_011638 [Botrytis porri]KAF7883129.1 hypothetical protein EAF01_011638 [Botrytis porri]
MPPHAPSEDAPPSQSQSQLRPNLAAHHRSTSSVTSHQSDSPAGTPPASGTTATQHKEPKAKGERKHVVGHGKYGRVSSNKALHKLSRTSSTNNHNHHHSHTTSNDNLKEFQAPWDKPHNSSTNLNRQKNISQTALKRNRSSADVQSTTGQSRKSKNSDEQHGKKRPNSVHFELGIDTPGKTEVEDDTEEGWEETSSTASPALSRSANTSAKPSAANSAANSRHQSPLSSPKAKRTNGPDSVRDFAKGSTDHFDGNGSVKTDANTKAKRNSYSTADAKLITEKLLQRTPSHLASETKMSMATAKPTPKMAHAHSGSMDRSTGMVKSMGASTASGNQELISRFVGDAGTPGENSPKFPPPDHGGESRTGAINGSALEKTHGGIGEMARAKSMGNLTKHNVDEEEESALLPRSRKSSTSGVSGPPNAYNSRTQQKLWLQRASSNIEPHREGLGALSLLNGGMGMGNHGGASSMGFGPGMGIGMGMGMGNGGYLMGGDGKGDPRIKVQLERTGLEYLVVRRHQDPVGRGIKRLEKMGELGHGGKNILGSGNGHGHSKSASVSRAGSLRERNGNLRKGVRQTYDGEERGSDTDRDGGSGLDEENVAALLRSLWEKSFEGSGSAD